jgi:hypothetical protein
MQRKFVQPMMPLLGPSSRFLLAVFAGVIYFSMGYGKMPEYVTGYTLEKTLSVDNMFLSYC